MNDPSRLFPIRRILVAIDASPDSWAALDAAAELAAETEAEILGLFVEDINLLRLAESPYAREIVYPTAAGAPLDRARMESQLRAHSAQAEKAVAAAGRREEVRWSFRSIRGDVIAEIRAAAGEADLLAIGRSAWSFGLQARVSATALELAKSATPVLLLSERGLPANARVVVHYDGSAGSQRALAAATQLKRSQRNGMTVLVAAPDAEAALKLQKEVEPSIRDAKIEVKYRRVRLSDQADLLRALSAESPALFVSGTRIPDGGQGALERVLRQTDVSLLLLEDGEGNANPETAGQ
ncbi:MAG TPA: universal stress protein [Candidatus Acidoferrales bacterium]|nr:universal stress protein [Candidatus Acidoferrales bacterium]